MNDKVKTKQEEFWAGEFGDSYIERNMSDQLLASNLNYFSKILDGCSPIESVLELGANIGMNMKALKLLLPAARLAGVEINQRAFEKLVSIDGVEGHLQSIYDFVPQCTFDFVFIKGVLIHLDPTMLSVAYEKLFASSHKYVCIGEYYNPLPVALPYRGHEGKLFKRDFAGEFHQKYPDVELIKYGFAYRKDPLFPQDDINWFLFRKKGL
jgi:pseudaminic acid biosynthesis-associated methylase